MIIDHTHTSAQTAQCLWDHSNGGARSILSVGCPRMQHYVRESNISTHDTHWGRLTVQYQSLLTTSYSFINI